MHVANKLKNTEFIFILGYCNLLSIIIPNYNREKDILETLKSVYDQEYDYFEVIVVDDNSNDNSVTEISKTFPKTKIILFKENKGPAIARNVGISRAQGDIIVGIDSDITFKERTSFTKIYSMFNSNEHVHGLAFRIMNYYTNTDDIDRWWHPLPSSKYVDKKFYTYYFSGSGYAFRRNVLIKSGLYPEELFMFNEEVDLALRIIDNDFNILYDPSITVLHKVSPQARVGIIPYYYKRRNQLWMVVKYYPVIKGLTFILPRLVKTLFLSIKDRKLGSYLRGLYSGIRALPREIKLRKPLKKETWTRMSKMAHNRYTS